MCKLMDEMDKCKSCLDEIKEKSEITHAEIIARSDETLNNVFNTVTDVLNNVNDKVESKLSKMEDQVDNFLKDQEDKFTAKIDKLISFAKWIFGTVVVVLMAYGGIISYVSVAVAKKADKNEVLMLNDARALQELGDEYRDLRYQLKDSAYVDPTNYKFLVGTIFERASRGNHVTIPLKPNNN